MKLDYQSKHQLSVLLQDSLDFKMHVQSSLEFGIIEEGSCEFICSGKQYSLKPGDVYIAFPDQPHAYFGSQNLKAYLLLVPIKSFLRSFYSTLTKQVPKKAVLSTDEWDKSIHQVLKLAYKDAPTAAPVIMQGYLRIILGKLFNSLELVERCNTAEDALYKILVYINGNYRDKITRANIAKAVGYNESYISHLFSETMRTTIPDYLHRMRIEDACNMLRSTSLSISQISAEVGFTSIRNFNRIFQAKTGMTPHQFRNNLTK